MEVCVKTNEKISKNVHSVKNEWDISIICASSGVWSSLSVDPSSTIHPSTPIITPFLSCRSVTLLSFSSHPIWRKIFHPLKIHWLSVTAGYHSHISIDSYSTLLRLPWSFLWPIALNFRVYLVPSFFPPINSQDPSCSSRRWAWYKLRSDRFRLISSLNSSSSTASGEQRKHCPMCFAHSFISSCCHSVTWSRWIWGEIQLNAEMFMRRKEMKWESRIFCTDQLSSDRKVRQRTICDLSQWLLYRCSMKRRRTTRKMINRTMRRTGASKRIRWTSVH